MSGTSHEHQQTGSPVADRAGEKLVSEHPRAADVQQLEAVYRMHRDECRTCTPEQPCAVGRRLAEARRLAGIS